MWRADGVGHYYIIQEENFPDYMGLEEDKDEILWKKGHSSPQQRKGLSLTWMFFNGVTFIALFQIKQQTFNTKQVL